MGAYQDLIANPAEIMSRLNPHSGFGSGNCPATAAALAHYLDTGQIVPASGNFGGGFIIREEAEAHEAPTIAAIIRLLQSLGSDHRIVVYGSERTTLADETGHHHFCVLLKVDREIYYADAYTRPPVLAAGDAAIRGYCSWMHSFLYWTEGFHVVSTH